MHRRTRQLLPALGLTVALAALGTGCGSSTEGATSGASGSESDAGTLTLYSAQHEQMTEGLTKAFEEKTGASVQIHFGEDEGLASQIEQEGSASPADVLLTENTPPLEALGEEGLLAKVDPSTLKEVPSRYSSPQGDWVGIVARETVMIYNPKLISRSELPASVLDLARPEWKGKLAIAPSEADFVPVVRAVEEAEGKAGAKEWLEGFAANAKHYNDNEGIVAAVDAGQVAAGIVNHYYWYEAVAEKGAKNVPSRLHYFGHEDPGALVDVSGAGVLESSGNPELAQEFLAFAVSKEGQEAIVASGDWEYPLHAGVTPPAGLKPFDSLEPPKFGPSDLGDGSAPLELMQEVGLL